MNIFRDFNVCALATHGTRRLFPLLQTREAKWMSTF